MERSLSALLPVRDVQSTLSGTVLELLDVLPDLTSRFEIVVVDDSSSDATIEVADELAAYYPQVKALRYAAQKGRAAAIDKAVRHSSGEILFLADAGCTLSGDEIHRLWKVIGDHEVVLGRSSQPVPWRWNGRLISTAQNREGFCMFHRRVFESIRGGLGNLSELRNFLAAKDLACHEVDVRDRALQAPHRRRKTARLPPAADNPIAPAQHTSLSSTALREPNYLTRVRHFAIGE